MLKVENHFLQGDGVSLVESPNRGGRFAEDGPDTIIIHYTAGRSAESSVRTLCRPQSKASAHLVVGRDGSTTQLVGFDRIAWHAGKSSFGERRGMNKYSIGIEIDNAGKLKKTPRGYESWFGKVYPEEDVFLGRHRNERTISPWHAYTEEQIDAVYEICQVLIENYNIQMILGHEEVSPGRKIDPGPAFPLDALREKLLPQVSEERASEESVELEETQTEQIDMSGLVQASLLNIRSGPGGNYEKVGKPLERGSLLKIKEEKNGWYRVKITKEGWVKKDFVKT